VLPKSPSEGFSLSELVLEEAENSLTDFYFLPSSGRVKMES
jgi:hypothetical protein